MLLLLLLLLMLTLMASAQPTYAAVDTSTAARAFCCCRGTVESPCTQTRGCAFGTATVAGTNPAHIPTSRPADRNVSGVTDEEALLTHDAPWPRFYARTNSMTMLAQTDPLLLPVPG